MTLLAPEFTALILAGTTGLRWFPLTSNSRPKHLSPVAGIPILVRQLQTLAATGFTECVVAIAKDDKVTVEVLLEGGEMQALTDNDANDGPASTFAFAKKLKVVLHHLPDDCSGSLQALKHIEEASLIPSESHVVVLPSDLVIMEDRAIADLVHAHRQGNASNTVKSACTMFLTDVGEQDEHGIPLKESAKAKRGILSREDDDIEYIALSKSSSLSPRVVWKEPKIDVEEDLDMVGSSPKLILPKPRLRHGITTTVRTDWNDVHVYVLSPWVRKLATARAPVLVSIAGDLIPLLVERQFQGMESTFGNKEEAKAIFNASFASAGEAEGDVVQEQQPQQEYSVRASILDNSTICLRASSLPVYLIACRELVGRAVAAAAAEEGAKTVTLPPDASLNSKYSSLIMSNVELGEKVQIKSSVVGTNAKLGTKTKLNNVVVMNGATVGDNVVLQNAVLGEGCAIGDNCSLSNVRVGHGQMVSSGTKEKGDYSMDEI